MVPHIVMVCLDLRLGRGCCQVGSQHGYSQIDHLNQPLSRPVDSIPKQARRQVSAVLQQADTYSGKTDNAAQGRVGG